MTSSPFERQITESDAPDRRTAPAASKLADGPQQYPAGPSFLEHDRPAVRLVELPAWLQAFAASVGEPAVAEPPEPELDLLTEGDMSFEDKPAPTSEASADEEPSKPTPAATFNSSFISEDDLPEWLRSIAPEEGDESGADGLVFGGGNGSDHVAVPNVARAWTTSSDARGVDESTSLFAIVASQATHGALPPADTVPARTAGRGAAKHAAEPARGDADADPAAPTMHVREEAAAAGVGETSQVDAPTVKGGLPMLPIAVAVILVLALIVVAVLFAL